MQVKRVYFDKKSIFAPLTDIFIAGLNEKQ